MNDNSTQLQEEIIQSIGHSLLVTQTDLNAFRNNLSNYIHTLINEDFEKLVYILYRLDISERKIKELLSDSHNNAGLIIADLIIERQLQKLESRIRFRQQNRDIPDDEKW